MTTTVAEPTIAPTTATGPAARMRDMVARAAPALRASAAASESARSLAPAAMDAMIDAGIPRAFLPAAYGGAALGPVHGVQLFEELAMTDSAAAWVGAITAAGTWLTILLPPTGGEALLADPRAVINGSLFPPMTAVPAPGGYLVSGRSAFCSGADHTTWFGFQAVIMDGGVPRMAPNGMPATLLVHVPAAKATVVDHWDTLGMRGTGSHDVQVDGAFVPEQLTWPMGPFAPANPAFTDALGRMGLWWFSPLVASVALGVARAAVSALADLAQAKVPSYTQALLADRPVVQDRLARARAAVDAARAYLYAALARAEEDVRTLPRLDIEHGIPLALAASHAVEAAATAVDLVHGCAGASGIRHEQPFAQHFRDVHTISQHAFVSPARFESVGKLMLGRESDWPLYYV